jgi:hypothetical protein
MIKSENVKRGIKAAHYVGPFRDRHPVNSYLTREEYVETMEQLRVEFSDDKYPNIAQLNSAACHSRVQGPAYQVIKAPGTVDKLFVQELYERATTVNGRLEVFVRAARRAERIQENYWHGLHPDTLPEDKRNELARMLYVIRSARRAVEDVADRHYLEAIGAKQLTGSQSPETNAPPQLKA